MNSKYMDFVPSKPQKPPVKRRVVKSTSTSVSVKTRPAKPVSRPAAPRPTSNSATPAVKPKVAKPTKSTKPLVALGVVEDLTPKFTKTSVPKKPLGTPKHFVAAPSPARQAKAKAVGNKAVPVEKPVEKTSKKSDNATYKTPKTPFINQDKVKKRPLSRNVYQKRPTPVDEKPKAPVTIITKPEKDSHIGLIITIVLTIILGAAAGTVAFLLLPK